MENIEIIKQAGAKLLNGSPEWELWQTLYTLGSESAQWAELIAQDIQVKEMNINAFMKYTMDFAVKQVKNKRNGMPVGVGEAIQRQSAIDFYKLPKIEPTADAPKRAEPEVPKPQNQIIDLLDLL